MVNEIAQWAVLVFLAVCSLGLTRQLGRFIVPQNEQRADEFGPPLRAKLPNSLLTHDQRTAIDAAMRGVGGGWAAMMVVDQQCEACDAWIEGLEHVGKPEGGPIVAISKGKSDGRHEHLARLVDVIVPDEDGSRTRAAELRATPFLMIIDADHRVVYKQVAGDLFEGVARWRARDDEFASEESHNGRARHGSVVELASERGQ